MSCYKKIQKIGHLLIQGDSCQVVQHFPDNFFQLIIATCPFFNPDPDKQPKQLKINQYTPSYRSEKYLKMVRKIFRNSKSTLRRSGHLIIIKTDFPQHKHLISYEIKKVCEKLGYFSIGHIEWRRSKNIDILPTQIHLLTKNKLKKKSFEKKWFVKQDQKDWSVAEEIYRRLIVRYSLERDYILNPFCGFSGNFHKACEKTKRKGVGIEILPENIKSTQNQIKKLKIIFTLRESVPKWHNKEKINYL